MDINTQRRLAKYRRRILNFMDRIAARAKNPDDLPSMTEDEQRALKIMQHTYSELVREALATSDQSPPQIVINLDTVSTEELKKRLRK